MLVAKKSQKYEILLTI